MRGLFHIRRLLAAVLPCMVSLPAAAGSRDTVSWSMPFTIQVEEMTPMRFSSRALDYGYSLTLTADSVEFYLPYMGEVYQAEFQNDGLDMKRPVYSLVRRQGKKGRLEIGFSCRRNMVEYVFRLTLFPNGKACIRLRPSNAQSIEYEGEAALHPSGEGMGE